MTYGVKPRPAPERFWPKVQRASDDECWPWTGAVCATGYGRFMVRSEGRTKHVTWVHRYAYELLVGPIPEGLTIDHLCKNRSCVNPKHMEPVPNGVNAMRGNGPAATNKAKTHCKWGHPFEGENFMVRNNGGRRCLLCQRIYGRERSARRRARTEVNA